MEATTEHGELELKETDSRILKGGRVIKRGIRAQKQERHHGHKFLSQALGKGDSRNRSRDGG